MEEKKTIREFINDDTYLSAVDVNKKVTEEEFVELLRDKKIIITSK